MVKEKVKNLRFIRNPWYPSNFKEYDYLLDKCIEDIDKLLFARKKLNNELKDVRNLQKHLLKNPVVKGAKGDET